MLLEIFPITLEAKPMDLEGKCWDFIINFLFFGVCWRMRTLIGRLSAFLGAFLDVFVKYGGWGLGILEFF